MNQTDESTGKQFSYTTTCPPGENLIFINQEACNSTRTALEPRLCRADNDCSAKGKKCAIETNIKTGETSSICVEALTCGKTIGKYRFECGTGNKE